MRISDWSSDVCSSDLEILRALLQERFGNHPHVGEIRGRGYFVGIELVADRAGKATFDPARATHQRVKQAAMDRGLICYPTGGAADGVRGDHVIVAPPYITTDAELAEIVERLGEAIDARSEEHTSELQSLMRISYAVFCLKKK